MDNMPNFDSIEEIKSYLNSTEAEHSAVVILDENKKPKTIPFKLLVKEIGLDKAAEFIYETQGHAQRYGLSRDEYLALKEKAKKDPTSLTEEEKRLFIVGYNVFEKGTQYMDTMNDIVAIVVKTFMELERTGDYGSLLAGFLTITEGVLVASSEKLSGYSENDAIFKEVTNNVMTQITIPEDMDEELLLLGLLHTIGERFITKNGHVSTMKANYKKFAELFGLDPDICNADFEVQKVYDEPVSEEPVSEEPSSNTPVDGGKVVDVRSRMKGLS